MTFIIYSYIPLWLLKHLWASIRRHKSLDLADCECKAFAANGISHKYDVHFVYFNKYFIETSEDALIKLYIEFMHICPRVKYMNY